MRRSRSHSKAISAVRRAIGDAGYSIEALPVLALEAAMRTWQRLDSRLYRQQLRIRTVREGRLTKATDRFIVLVIYTGAAVPAFTRTFIEALKQSAFNLVVISNGNLLPAEAAELLGNCCLLVERNNIGRDFGGYKDGISLINQRFGSIKRLVLANDSVFYIGPGLERLIADLDGDDDIVGISETYEHHYHVGSFLMSFGPTVLENELFRKFWETYRPIGTRRWVIFNGEGALTNVLLRAGFRPRILFRVTDLKEYLQARTAEETARILSLLPPDARGDVEADLEQGVGLAEAIISAAMGRNQMHTAGFLFREYCGLSLVKRDLFYRGIYPLEDIERAFGAAEPSLWNDILNDLTRRGRIGDRGWFSRLLYRHSVI